LILTNFVSLCEAEDAENAENSEDAEDAEDTEYGEGHAE
jgi:hypothetical protein